MGLSKKEVEHVANLARLSLSEEEKMQFADQLSSILDLAQKLNEVDTEQLKPTSHALDITNVFREDEARESIPRETALKNAPDQKDGHFKVPPVMEG